MKYIFILALLALVYTYIKRSCQHKWKLVDEYHSKKSHTMIFTCTECNTTKTETVSRH